MEADRLKWEQAEQARQESVEKALAVFKKNPRYSRVLLNIHGVERFMEDHVPTDANRLSEALLEHLLSWVDLQGHEFLQLVVDPETVEAFRIIMDDCFRRAWWQFSWLPMETVPMAPIFEQKLPLQVQLEKLRRRALDWVMEGHRRLVARQDSENAPSETNQSEQAAAKPSHKALRDAYFAMFPDEKIKILDLCWAVGQHYREWKRWVNGEAKDGGTADLAFRRILTSGKRPSEFNRKPRPNNWQ
jgi:hypothetical protein